MITYQDLLEVGEEDKSRMEFVLKVINEHKSSDLYQAAVFGEDYDLGRNTTIITYQKWLYKATGEKIPDIWSANYKMPSNFLHRFVTQKVQTSLANGISWNDEKTAEKLGTKKYPIDTQVKKLAKNASLHRVSYGFFNNDHIDIFTSKEFAPLYDDEDGALKAGVRFWQIAANKPLRAVLYEIDGYTEFIFKNGESKILKPKRPYKIKQRVSIIGGTEIYGGENYPTFPIVPMWADDRKISDLDPIREQIDCFDLIKSGYANTVDEASMIFWILQNAGGMDNVDVEMFLKKIRESHAVVADDDVTVQPTSVQAPFEARETLLKRLEKDIYKDAMALDVENIASGAATATEIKAAYEPLNSKCDDFEYCIIDFLNRIMEIAGIDDVPTFTRSRIINVNEDVQVLLTSAPYLSEEYVTEKILTLFGDGDKVDEMLKKMNADSLERLATGYKSKTMPDDENELLQGTEGE